MIIDISTRAKKYILNKGKPVTIYTTIYPGCWKIYEPELQVKLSPPEDIENYKLINNQGISFYIRKDITFENDTLVIKLKWIWPFRNIVASGLKDCADSMF